MQSLSCCAFLLQREENVNGGEYRKIDRSRVNTILSFHLRLLKDFATI